jgi:hypothetical protein
MRFGRGGHWWAEVSRDRERPRRERAPSIATVTLLAVRSWSAIAKPRSRVGLLIVGLILLIGAWIAATAPFAAPDEASHYDRAYGLTNGVVLGRKVVYGPDPQLTPTQQAFINHDTTSVVIPARLMPPDVGCIGNRPNVTQCPVAVPNGNFPPLGYILPAVALSVSHNVTAGFWLTRTASAIQSVVFLVLAIALLWDASPWSMLGLVGAVSPMVLFVSSIMSTSGIQVASCLAFAAAILRVTRHPDATPRWAWVALAISGTVGILTGPIGLVFVLMDLVLLAALLGRSGVRALSRLREARLSALPLVAAALISVVYSHVAGFAERIGFTPIGSSLHGGWSQLSPVLHDAVGDFASQTVPLPSSIRIAWWTLVVVLIAGALVLGDRRTRVVLTLLCVVVVAFPVLFWAWIDRYSGFGLQGREVLPPLMMLPLCAGELINRRRHLLASRTSMRIGLGAIFALVAAIQAYAWWYSARTAAGAPLFLRFYAHATWQPIGGWTPWIVGAAAGTVALFAFAASASLDRVPLGDRTVSSAQLQSSPG